MKMDANAAVALYLTILMAVLCAITLIGGYMADKKKGEVKSSE
jgi:uncharacterized membrane protein